MSNPSRTRTGLPRARARGRAVLTAAAITGLVSATLVTSAAPVGANPAPDPTTRTISTPGSFTGIVPDGACEVRVTARGGAGGSVIQGVANTNGAGATVSATYPVVPGQPYTGYVGGGGQPSTGAGGQAGNGGPNPGVGGAGDPATSAGSGGRGGTVGAGSTHAGAGGGGRSSVAIAGTELVVAGGGGGSAGGHDTNGGFGGDAGLPTAFDTVTAGSDGLDGTDVAPAPATTAGGGQGGQPAGQGAGGVHQTDASLDGFDAVAGTGGNGGNDPNFDSGGGGGGGTTGGGGGASTRNNGSGAAVPGGNGGGGGGGGSSRVSSATPGGLPGTATGLAATAGPQLGATHAGAGANGLVELDWLPCEYDLGVTKAASPIDPATGAVTWTVTVTNHGPDAMARGDVVTLTDTLPGTGTPIVTTVATPVGVTCDVVVGSPMTSPMTCSRPNDRSAVGGSADGVRGLDVGESIAVGYTQNVTAPGTYPNTATVTDRSNPTNNRADAQVVVTGPTAGPRTSVGPQGEPQSQPPDVTAGTFAIDAASLTLLDGPGGSPVAELVIPGQGTYSIVGGDLVFTPEPDFQGAPTPVHYRISDTQGNHAASTYAPSIIAANPDYTSGPQGAIQTVDPLLNDVFGAGSPADPDTLVLLDSNGDPVTELAVSGVGTFTVVDGTIQFVPEPDFTGSHTVPYRVFDEAGTPVESTYTPTIPVGDPDVTSGPQGIAQDVDPLANDHFSAGVPADPSTLTLLDPDSGDPVTSVTVPDQGVYTIDASDRANPRIVFTPTPEFIGTATPVTYRVLDQGGVPVTSTYTPTLTPTARPDTTSGPQGVLQTIDPLLNDDPDGTRDLDPATLRLVDPVTGDPTSTVTVPDVGTFTVVDGEIHFQPVPDFVGEGPAIGYLVDDVDGHTVGSTYTPTVVAGPAEVLDSHQTHPVGTTAEFDLVDLEPNLDPGSVHILDPDGNEVHQLVVPGEGVWTVDPGTGKVTFVPEAGFEGDPTPVRWAGAKTDGTPITGMLSIDYVQAPAPSTPSTATTPRTASTTGTLPVTGAGVVQLALVGILFVLGGAVLALRPRRALDRVSRR